MTNAVVRNIETAIFGNFLRFPVIAILGAEECGKTTFFQSISDRIGAFRFFDLQKWDHIQALLNDSESVFTTNEKITFCLDNIRLAPELLPIIDRLLHEEKTTARFIIMGVLSEKDFLASFTHSLHRVCIMPFTPLTIKELYHPTDFSINRHWLRGGFPKSYFATSDANSAAWRREFLGLFIEKDCIRMGIQFSGMQIFRLANLLAQHQGGFFNASRFAAIFGVTHPTIRHYIDLLEQSYFIRVLLSYPQRTGKRTLKAPKIYLRDSGLLHTLLSLETIHELQAHSIRNVSWKGYVIENILSYLTTWKGFFYETPSGAGFDLILMKNKIKIAVKIYSAASEIQDNILFFIKDIKPDHSFIIAQSVGKQLLSDAVTLCDLPDFIETMWKNEKWEAL